MADNADLQIEMPDVETLSFTVDDAEAGVRLDSFLASKIPGWSRSRIQRLIEDGDVLVNGRTSRSSLKLRAGDNLEVELAQPTTTNFVPEDIPLDIVFEDAELVVVNKQAGMIVHPGAGAPSGTLANALAFHFATLSQRGGATRPGIVHRLDKDTSGLIVVAKTEAAHEKLAEQFRLREVFKSYVALVHGSVKPDKGRIDQPIARDRQHRTRMAVVRGGREALTLFRVKQRFERFTLVDVEIKTGRTHQIRVHLAWLKHPVVSDETYSAGRDKTISDPQIRSAIAKLGRVCLHAERLGFRHPRTGEYHMFVAPLPQELGSLLALLP